MIHVPSIYNPGTWYLIDLPQPVGIRASLSFPSRIDLIMSSCKGRKVSYPQYRYNISWICCSMTTTHQRLTTICSGIAAYFDKDNERGEQKQTEKEVFEFDFAKPPPAFRKNSEVLQPAAFTSCNRVTRLLPSATTGNCQSWCVRRYGVICRFGSFFLKKSLAWISH